MAKEEPEYLPSLGRLLGMTSASCTTLSNRQLEKHGLTVHQWIVMTALWRNAPMPESQLASYCKITLSALNRMIDRMKARGLILTSIDEHDKRVVLVDVSPAGAELAHLLNFYDEINDTLMNGFSEEERAALVSMLERVFDNVTKALNV